MRLKIINTKAKFAVQVMDGKNLVIELDWYGGKSNRDTKPFEYNGKLYVVFGPYHSFLGTEDFRLFEMTEVTKA